MATRSPYERARLRGLKAASDEIGRLGLPLRERIDIFSVIEEQRVWLFTEPMRYAYGAYARSESSGGILLNSQHPVTTQRFTAAHEYGHHVLGHEASADQEEQMFRSQRLLEVEAQAFAGEFLMPLQLVNFTLRTMGFDPRSPALNPLDVYKVALELGVSYRAAVVQLVNHKKVTRTAARRFASARPLALKTHIGGVKPEFSWADVWILDGTQEGRAFSPTLRDEIHVELAETPSSGYVWEIVDPASEVLTLAGEAFEPQNGEEVIGSAGERHFLFRVADPGYGQLRLEMRRPWLDDAQPVARFEATISASRRLSGDEGSGPSVNQREALLEEVSAA
jgi:Zn-dependent peptidase ImmA (M78 family)/predicted secreted protein